MLNARKKESVRNKKVNVIDSTLLGGTSSIGLQVPQNLKDCVDLWNGADKELVKELDNVPLDKMSTYMELNKQSDTTQDYVTRGAKIGCSCGEYHILLDALEDHGVIAINGRPLLTCRDCRGNINIHSFGKCFAEVKGYGKLPRPTNDRISPVGDKWIYRCIPNLTGRWMQKESVLQIEDGEGEEYCEVLVSGAYLPCRHGGIIEVVEVPEGTDDEQSEKILPLESKWLEEHTKGMDYIEYVTMEFLEELGWFEIADYFMDEETGERSDWMRTCEDGIYRFEPDPKIVRHYRPLDEQDIINLNRVFVLYDITNRERICAFLSQTAHESGYGTKMCELVGNKDTKNTRSAMEQYILENNLKNGILKYPYQYRGGGAIHTTHKGNYENIFREITGIEDDEIIENIATEYTGDNENAMEEEKIISIGTEYVAYNYPWLSAGIYWKNNDLNTILETEKTNNNEKDEIGILGVIGVINPGSEYKNERAQKYADCLIEYDKHMGKEMQETLNE